jgi:hypothetical protein
MIQIDFDTWKAEYEPRVYEDSGAYCFDHEDQCDCEFLYTYQMGELQYYLDTAEDDKELGGEDARDNLAIAISENRVWSWLDDRIVIGVVSQRSDLLVTTKPWTENVEVI